MKNYPLISVILFTLFLGGCQLTHVEGEVDGVNIRATTDENKSSSNHGNGSFCPPGQAKKGNC
ncbi:hypothetical protein [Photobacterium alginatilyticum]|uniref:Lipoprotein n=1 Tax=Photobacterium alginatilyticum TaxID=1775171 RepID=A0ABW9YIG9_9GAMM|nr:hypothetical protein [Photobacterium alginatilyticum]NBI53336.1 hypothetical protein [Photobacterium alginatilyticum]